MTAISLTAKADIRSKIIISSSAENPAEIQNYTFRPLIIHSSFQEANVYIAKRKPANTSH